MSTAAERMRRKRDAETEAETNERLSKVAEWMRRKRDAESEVEINER